MDKPEPAVPLSLLKESLAEFQSAFYEPLSISIQAKTSLHLHVLRVQNGDFDLANLYRVLKNNSIAYVLSRLKYKKAIADPAHIMEVAAKVQEQFRPPDPNAGEGGEVLLYSLLEGHLGAPKILSKMELKTNPKHYVYGSDGVHLLRTADNSYELIFGESKMYGDAGTPGRSIKRGIEAAFKSIGGIDSDDLDFDTWLVQSELLKEDLDQENLSVLAAILLPSATGGDDAIKKNNAFGIFVGYEIDVSDMVLEDLQLDEIEQELRLRAANAVTSQQELIKDQVAKYKLGGYPIHLYAVPFTSRTVGETKQGIDKVRLDLAAHLSNKPGSK